MFRSNAKRQLLLLSAAAIGLFPLGPVLASDAGSETAATRQADEIEEVIVTSRRRAENAQKAPVAITAFSEEALNSKIVQNVIDLQGSTPSFHAQSDQTSPMGLTLALRGQAQYDNAANQTGSVGVYLDDLYDGGASLSGRLLGVADLERVEIDKGPQGTLYGRNVTGGVLKFVTNKPTDDYEGYLKLGLGNYDQHLAEGMANLPIIDGKAALRVVGSFDEHSGFSRDIVNGRDLEDQHNKNFRAELKLDPTDKLDVLIQGFAGSGYDGGPDARTIYLQPGVNTGSLDVMVGAHLTTAQALAPYFLYGAAVGAGKATPAQQAAFFQAYSLAASLVPAAQAAVQQQLNAPRDAVLGNAFFPERDHASVGGGSVTLSYAVDDDLTLKSITSYIRNYRLSDFNVGGGPWVPLFTDQTATNRQGTEELQAIGTGVGGKLKYNLGVYLYDSEIAEVRNLSSSGGPFPLLLGNYGLGLTGPQFADNALHVTSEAIYGQATYALTDTVNLTEGLRWTTEHSNVVNNTIGYLGLAPFAGGGAAFCAGPAPLTNATPLNQCFASAEHGNRNISYTAGVDWSVTDNSLLYVKTSRGFKSGGVNLYTSASTPITNYSPEISTDYEAGVKSTWFSRKLLFNADVYHTDYDNIQQTIAAAYANGSGGTIVATSTQNAARATIDGAEVETQVKPLSGLTFGLTLGYVFPKYLSYSQYNAAYPGSVEDLTSEPFQGISKWTTSVSSSYTYSTDLAAFTGEIDWNWRGSAALFSGDTLPTTPGGPATPLNVATQKGYGLWNASLVADLADGHSSLRIWGKNILDRRYLADVTGLVNSGIGTAWGGYGPPATFGADFTYRF